MKVPHDAPLRWRAKNTDKSWLIRARAAQRAEFFCATSLVLFFQRRIASGERASIRIAETQMPLA